MPLTPGDLSRAADIRTQTLDSDSILLAAQVSLLLDIRALLTESVERRAAPPPVAPWLAPTCAPWTWNTSTVYANVPPPPTKSAEDPGQTLLAAHHARTEEALRALLQTFSPWFSRETVADITDFLAEGEYGLALETLSHCVKETGS